MLFSSACVIRAFNFSSIAGILGRNRKIQVHQDYGDILTMARIYSIFVASHSLTASFVKFE